jgi:hypothetical protein
MITITTYLITIKHITYNGSEYWFIYGNNKVFSYKYNKFIINVL